jgi:hypothetical protein
VKSRKITVEIEFVFNDPVDVATLSAAFAAAIRHESMPNGSYAFKRIVSGDFVSEKTIDASKSN